MTARFMLVMLAGWFFLTGCQDNTQTESDSTTKVAELSDGNVLKPSPQNGVSELPQTSEPEMDNGHPLQEFEERNDDPLAAAGDRFQRRRSADGTVPVRGLLNARDQRNSLLAARASQFANTGVWPVTWDWVGPGNIGGRLRPIVIHPTNANIMYVGSASGGIWKTTNGGSTWFPLDDFLPSLSVSDMVMHPSNTNTLYAGTGEGFFETVEGTSNTAAVRGAGIFVSNDAGVTWSQLPSTDNSDFHFVNRLAFDPSDSDTILAATTTGIWRTTDAGVSWTLQYAMVALDVQFDPNDALQVVAGGHHQHLGPVYSIDGGVTWNTASGAGGHRQEISWAPNSVDTVYAAVSDDPGRIKVWISTDGGQNYTVQTTGTGIQTWASYNNCIWVDPTDSDTMVVGGVWLYRSTDGGVTFTRRFNAVHADMHRVVQHPGFDGTTNKTVFFATDGGIWRTTDVYATTAVDLNNNLGVTQFYGGGINPATGDIIGGTQDNGTLFYSGDPQNWDFIFGGDGGYGAADPTDPNYFYGEVQRAYLHRTTNGGGSSGYIWNTANPIGDAGSSTNTNFIPFFTLDPNNSNRMLVACRQMWRSNNVKAAQPDWFSIKPNIEPPPSPRGAFSGGRRSGGRGEWGSRSGQKVKPKEAHFALNSPWNLSTIAVAKGNSDIIWAAHNNGHLYYTTNGTNASPTWTRVDENGLGLPDRWISTVVIDPADHNHVYVALMGWESDNIWETTDSGVTWADVSGAGVTAIPDAPVSALAMHPTMSGWLYAGTDVGVFASNDNGLSWMTQPGGPGSAPVEQLLWKDDQTLLAVTHGRGMYLATENSIQVSGIKLLDGVPLGGDVTDTYFSDDQYLQLDPSPTLNPVKQKIDLILQSTTGSAAPTEFQFRMQSKMIGGPAGDVIQSIRMFNYLTASWEVIDSRPASTTDSTVLVIPTGDTSRFVQAATLEMTASIVWSSFSFSGPPFTWSVDVDEAVWLTVD